MRLTLLIILRPTRITIYAVLFIIFVKWYHPTMATINSISVGDVNTSGPVVLADASENTLEKTWKLYMLAI